MCFLSVGDVPMSESKFLILLFINCIRWSNGQRQLFHYLLQGDWDRNPLLKKRKRQVYFNLFETSPCM